MPRSRTPTTPQVGEVELASLEHLWRVREANVGETHQAVGKPRGISVNTVGSALERLHRKGLVRRRKVSHSFRYQPALSRDAFAAQRLLAAGGGTEALSRGGVLSAFVDLLAEVDADSLDRLQALIDQKRGEREGES